MKIVVLALILILAIIICIMILFVNRRQGTQILSIHTFLGNSSSHLHDHEHLEQKKSIIEKMKEYFDDMDDDISDDGNGDSDDGGDDAGE